MRIRAMCIAVAFACLISMAFAGQAGAGFFDDVSKAANAVGKQISKDAKSVAQDMGITEKTPAKPAKLTGGVADRLKKINKELDKAENAMQKGAGSDVDRARRAQSYLKNADRIKGEIEKRYAGKYDPEHPDVTACYNRLEKTRGGIAAALGQAQQAETQAKQEADAQKAAKAQAASQAKAADERQKAQAAQAAQDAEATCDQWDNRLKQFTQGDKPLHVYATDDEAMLAKWKSYYDEAKQARAELAAADFDKSQCYALEATEKRLEDFMSRFEDVWAQYQASQGDKGGIIFSKSPINPQSPTGLTDSFQAGDHIYALIRSQTPWSQIFRGGGEGNLITHVTIDGKKIHSQLIILRKPEDLAKDYAILEVAPDPATMLSYTGKLPDYGKSTANMLQGPMELTHNLGKLEPGEHTVALDTMAYDFRASGSFKLTGSDYGFYAKLNQKMNSAAAKTVLMPQARMTNKSLESKMRALLKNAGWNDIYRLNIKDADWWIERVEGGNSPVKARYLNVAAMGRDGQGYFYQICNFHQDKLITGAWGELYLSHQGDKVRVLEENKDK